METAEMQALLDKVQARAKSMQSLPVDARKSEMREMVEEIKPMVAEMRKMMNDPKREPFVVLVAILIVEIYDNTLVPIVNEKVSPLH